MPVLSQYLIPPRRLQCSSPHEYPILRSEHRRIGRERDTRAVGPPRDRLDTIPGVGKRAAEIIIAETGNLTILKPHNQVWLNLKTAETHLWDPKKPDRYDLNSNVTQRMRLPDHGASPLTHGVPRSLREMNLRELFQQAGTVESVRIITDQFTGRPRGFGFVEMSSKEEGATAISQFNGKEVNGHALKVNEARPKVAGF